MPRVHPRNHSLRGWTRGCTHLAALPVAISAVKFQTGLKAGEMAAGARVPWYPCKAGQGSGFFGASDIWERSCGSSCLFLLMVAGVVFCSQTSVQEMSSSTAVAFVQPGRVIRPFFAFVMSSTKRLQVGEGRAWFLTSASRCWAETLLVCGGGRGF